MDPEIKLDPSTHLQWDRHGYRADLLTHPSFSLQNLYRSVAPKLNSMYEAILDYFVNHMTPDERVIAEMDGFEAINHVFRLISGEWLNIFHIIESDLTKLAFQREAPRVPFHYFQDQLSNLHKWNRHCVKYTELLEQNIFICEQRGPNAWRRYEHGKMNGNRQVQDFREIHRTFEGLKAATAKELDVIIGMISLETGKLSFSEAQRITRLTLVAFVFIPLSLVASLLSMNGDFALDSTRPWIYPAVAVPLAIIVCVAGLYAPQPRQDTLWEEEAPSFWELARKY